MADNGTGEFLYQSDAPAQPVATASPATASSGLFGFLGGGKKAAKTNINDYYTINVSAPIGKGNFATCYRGQSKLRKDSTNQPINVAVKVIPRFTITSGSSGSSNEAMAMQEIEVMKKPELKNGHIVVLYDAFATPTSFYLFTELVPGGHLLEVMMKKKVYLEDYARTVIRQLCEAVACLHKLHYAHLDIKCENLMLVSADEKNIQLKVIDFGLSRPIPPTAAAATAGGRTAGSTAIIGSPLYQPPEIVEQRGYNLSADCWAIGVVTYILLSGTPPFFPPSNSHSKQELFSIICTQPVDSGFDRSPSIWGIVSDESKDFIRKALAKKQDERASVDVLADHQWLKPRAALGAERDTVLLFEAKQNMAAFATTNFNWV